jgi:hypothetical protein
MFFMNDTALAQLDKAGGFEVGVGPTVVVMDEGKAKTMTTTTAKGRHLRLHFRAEGPHGRLGYPRKQDLED